MKKIFLPVLFLMLTSLVFAQQRPVSSYSYYIEIKNTGTKSQLAGVSKLITAKPGVTFFNFYRSGKTFFILMSQRPVTAFLLNEWIKPLDMQVEKIEQYEITDAFMREKRAEGRRGRENLKGEKQ